ncbi:hypothetical protein C8Q76DRAFT_737799 [Earliella scabrosa]|nr:hypothetical protein C8Q76DRAFT_737799 [Earliella scabrosa]
MLWGLVVSNYTRRLLTQKTDKLLAFAAVAEQFDRIWQPEWHPGRYVAGLWERFLPRDLLWYRELARNEWLDDELRPRLAGEDYAAPTWAWPSVDGHVITRTGTSPDSNGGAVDTCVVLACDVALLDQRLPYGRVSEGHLKLRTVLVPACVIIESPQVDPQRRAEYGESFYFRVFAFAAHPKGELEYEPEGPSPLDCDMACQVISSESGGLWPSDGVRSRTNIPF